MTDYRVEMCKTGDMNWKTLTSNCKVSLGPYFLIAAWKPERERTKNNTNLSIQLRLFEEKLNLPLEMLFFCNQFYW